MREGSIEATAVLQDLQWIRELARALVRDASTADDLVQDALLSTLEHPLPAHVPVRQSLAARLRNRARSMYRSRMHREQRESRVARGVEQSDDEVETRERIALAQHVMGLMAALPEPYRTVLRLRFLDELPPREIALRTGRNVDLVKLQLQRGLALLRTALDREHGGDRRVWVTALVPLMGSPAEASASVLHSKWSLIGACTLTVFAVLLWTWASGTPAIAKDDLRVSPTLVSTERVERPSTLVAAASADRALSSRKAVVGSTRFDLRVERGDSREPVVGAELRCWRLSRDEDAESNLEDWFRDGVLEERLGEVFDRVSSDSRGVASLPDTSSGWVVTATQGNLWGWLIVRLDDTKVPRLAMREDGDVVVQVLARDARPTEGVWVQLRATGYCGGGGEQGDPVYLRGLTNGVDGSARLRHAGYVKRATDSPCKSGAQVLFGVPGVTGDREPPISAVLDTGDWPTEPLEFRNVVPVGFCAIEFVGVPAHEQPDWSFQLGCRSESTEWSYDDFGWDDDGSEHFEAWSGVTRRAVGLGRELLIEARHRSGLIERLVHPGPATAGATVRVPFQPSRPQTCAGRLLGVDGQPLRNARFSASIATSGGDRFHAGPFGCRTRDDGGFEFVVGDPVGADDGGCVVSICTDGEFSSPIAATRGPAVVSTASLRLGDVRLENLPIVCAGTALDDTGTPVEGALVTVHFLANQDARLTTLQARTDAAGRFEARSGLIDYERVVVKAEKAGHVTAFCDSQRDLLSLRVVFGAAGSIRGCVLTDPSMRGGTLYVTASRNGSAGLDRRFATDAGLRSHRICGEDGNFAIDALPSGEYELGVNWECNSESPHTLWRKAVIPVGVGGAPSEISLGTIDLHASHRQVNVTVQDAAGNVLDGASVRSCFPRSCHDDEMLDQVSEQAWQFRATNESGMCEILVAAPSCSVRVGAPGFAEAEQITQMEDVLVVLQPAVPVRFLIDGGLPLLPPGCKLSLLFGDEDRIHRCLGNEYFDASGRADCSDPPIGDSSVRFALQRAPEGAWLGSVPISAEQRVSVDRASGQICVLRPPTPEAIADALRRLHETVGER